MKSRIKMIGLDLDGTVLTDDKVITEHTKKVIKEAVDQGVIVLPATGRPFHAIPRNVLEIPGIQYALTSNGARIVDMRTDEVVSETLLPYVDALDVITVVQKHGGYLEVFKAGKGYAEQRYFDDLDLFGFSEASRYYTTTTRKPVPDMEEFMKELHMDVDKVQGLFIDEDNRLAAQKELEEMERFEVTHATSFNLEMMAKGVDKGIGLIKLGEKLGIRREEIMACGDGMNDYAMLETVGFAVAMGNAVPPLKEIADYITETNEEDGVAKAIEQYVLL